GEGGRRRRRGRGTRAARRRRGQRADLPDVTAAITVGRKQGGAVGAERDRVHVGQRVRAGVGQGGDPLPGGHVPQVHAAAPGADGQRRAVGTERERPFGKVSGDAAGIGHGGDQPPGRDIPQVGAAGVVAGGQHRAVRAERRQGQAGGAGRGQGGDQTPGGDVPQVSLVDAAGGGQRRP